MTALDKYINDLVRGKDTEDDFPKNESSWEELFDLCKTLITKIVRLKRIIVRKSEMMDGCEDIFHQLMHAQGKNFCPDCGIRLKNYRHRWSENRELLEKLVLPQNVGGDDCKGQHEYVTMHVNGVLWETCVKCGKCRN